MAKPEQSTKVTLEDLLQLKRREIPSPEFWSRFERDFDNRRLQCLLSKEPARYPISRFISRFATIGISALGLAAFWAINGIDTRSQDPDPRLIAGVSDPFAEIQPSKSNAEFTVNRDVVDLPQSPTANLFVVDAIHQPEFQRSTFRRVLYAPALQLTTQPGSLYVRDAMISGEFRVTNTNARFGANF